MSPIHVLITSAIITFVFLITVFAVVEIIGVLQDPNAIGAYVGEIFQGFKEASQ